MELRKNSIRHYEAVMDECVTLEQSAEMIVPDSCPDIARIVDTAGLACLKDKTVFSDRLELSGLCKAGILYMPEGEPGLRKMDLNIPFVRSFEGAMEATGMAVASVRVLSAEARLVNPRKVQAAVTLMIEVKMYAARVLELTDDVLAGDGEKSMACEVLKSAENAWLLLAVQDKAVTVTEELEVPSGRPPAEEILKADVRLAAGEMKAIGTKAVFKGMASVRLLCAAEGRPYTLEQDFPFSQIIEVEGADEASSLEASLQLAGLEMDFLPGGESRKLSVTLYVDVTLMAYADRRVETVSDLYGLGVRLRPEMTPLLLHAVGERAVRRQNVRESIEVGEDVAGIVDAAALFGPVTGVNGGMGCDVVIKAVYQTEAGGYAQAVRAIRVPCPAEVTAACGVRAGLAGEVTATPMSGGLEVRFAVDFQVTQMLERPLLSVTGVISEPED
ncbi:MAG: DUF3794 domain-containing protein, partial [Oscillospiraceae bacterium]|nr:DUF3794 domain-containing protein [Oscillospiraceae bacterium]